LPVLRSRTTTVAPFPDTSSLICKQQSL
jgi:hypothetical protein